MYTTEGMCKYNMMFTGKYMERADGMVCPLPSSLYSVDNVFEQGVAYL